MARVYRMLIRLPTPYGPPTHPVLTSQQSAPYRTTLSARSLAYLSGWWTMNGPPKQVLNVISGSLPRPTSVPAIFDVYPDMNW